MRGVFLLSMVAIAAATSASERGSAAVFATEIAAARASSGHASDARSARVSNRAFVSLTASTLKVLYGHSARLSGRVSNGRSHEEVAVLARPYGSPAPTSGTTVVTGAGGRWSFQASPSIQTTYVARFGAALSRSVVIGVEPRLVIALLADGTIDSRVVTWKPLARRLLQLQQLTPAGDWSTIRRARLDRRGRAAFAPPSGTSSEVLRVALSVNQAGAGLLGASSHAFVYHHPACPLFGVFPFLSRREHC